MDFEKYVKDALAAGKTSEEIAKAFTDTINKVEQEQKNSAENKARDFYHETVRTFNANYGKNRLTFDDVGRLALSVADTRDWTVEEMVSFVTSISESAEWLAKSVKKNQKQFMTDLIDELMKPVGERLSRVQTKVDPFKEWINSL